ncbi:hypothetical protein PSQ90_07315 [Devosia rhodophyticola]|uniref:Uncharacterized protein n=1 Tax=Devosia rhodophyticola TaxID=3026423 RepID=A0ABY7Z0U2_9HYPH|nr:hypothetical protein [Devosia rhodophyticola]WDR07226.1 hypothetical protein PSQ90_07315 [Devosia rhodophyticola]
MGMVKEDIGSALKALDFKSVLQRPGVNKMTVRELLLSVLDDVENSSRNWVKVMGQ